MSRPRIWTSPQHQAHAIIRKLGNVSRNNCDQERTPIVQTTLGGPYSDAGFGQLALSLKTRRN